MDTAGPSQEARYGKPHIVRTTGDSYQNLLTRVGIGAGSVNDAATYRPTFLTRNPYLLDSMFRSNWLAGKAVAVVAEDMTRAGVDIVGSDTPEDITVLLRSFRDKGHWDRIRETITWGRLYGGALGIILIDGQDLTKPLRPETVRKDQFRGIMPIDRWWVVPSLTDFVTDYGPEFGLPAYYKVQVGAPGLKGEVVHHTRCLRFGGDPIPWRQRQAENGWDQSVLERVFDRIVAFDSATHGAAQLLHKAHLRIMKVAKLREMIALNQKGFENISKQVEFIRQFQTSEGLTLLDAEDDMEFVTYNFAGLTDVLIQFGQQVGGALDIPLVRFFGQSPVGLNATGDSDMRLYESKIAQEQEKSMRHPLGRALAVHYRSELNRDPPPDFDFSFNPLSPLRETERTDIAAKITVAVGQAYGDGIISQRTAMAELKQSSQITGIFTNIRDEDVEAADEELPPRAELALPDPDQTKPGEKPGADIPTSDAAAPTPTTETGHDPRIHLGKG